LLNTTLRKGEANILMSVGAHFSCSATSLCIIEYPLFADDCLLNGLSGFRSGVEQAGAGFQALLPVSIMGQSPGVGFRGHKTNYFLCSNGIWGPAFPSLAFLHLFVAQFKLV